MRENAKRGNRLRRSLTLLLISVTVLCTETGAFADGGKTLIPMGCAVGIEMQTDGVVVVGISPVEAAERRISPAGEAGIEVGDVIVGINGSGIKTAEDFAEAVGAPDGSPMDITVRRGGREIPYSVVPLMDGGGTYRLGLWLRDSLSGIGTLTYMNPEDNSFGALGHAITDMNSGEIVPLGGGTLTDAVIVDVIAGAPGTPGELCGAKDGAEKRGDIYRNTLCGIFGIMNTDGMELPEAVQAADESEIETGAARILSTVDGSGVREFDVEITRVYHGSDDRSMMLRVTDPELLGITGGIVQGMSGSPIMQNGKIIGAVTHVLVSDPTRGYGISIEKMLKASEAPAEQAA